MLFRSLLAAVEPLKSEVMHFIECVHNGTQPLTDGENGLSVVRIMEAVNVSVQKNGTPVYLKY